jgi:hypothetical protein
MDSAFNRRIQLSINFPTPGPDLRLRLLESFIPSEAPLAADVDLRRIAQGAPMQLHRKDYMPRYMQHKEHPGMQQTRDLDYLEMLDREDHKATAKSGGSLVQLAAPVVQRQALQGVVQREPERTPDETKEEYAAIVLSEESPALANLIVQYKQIKKETKTIHNVITDALGMRRNRERRLRKSFGDRNYEAYASGRRAGAEFGSFWKGLQNSGYDTAQFLRWRYTWAGLIGAGIAQFDDAIDSGLSDLDTLEAESNAHYRAFARSIIHHLRGRGTH